MSDKKDIELTPVFIKRCLKYPSILQEMDVLNKYIIIKMCLDEEIDDFENSDSYKFFSSKAYYEDLITEYRNNLNLGFNEKFISSIGLDYIDLYVTQKNKKNSPIALNEETQVHKINLFNVIFEHQRIGIIAPAGMGKSFALLNFVTYCCSEKYDYIPVYIELKKVPSTPDGLENLINRSLSEFENRMDLYKLKHSNNQRKVIFLFDGFDEIATGKEIIYNSLNKILFDFKHSKVVITSRPTELREGRLFDLETFEIEPLSQGDVKTAIKRFFENDEEKQKLIFDNLSINKKIEHLLKNPHFLYLTCEIISLNGAFPKNKAQVFENFFNSLKNKRERQKNTIFKHFGFIKKVLGNLAFFLIDGNPKYISDPRYIEEEMLYDLIHDVISEQPNTYFSLYKSIHPQDIVDEYLIKTGFLKRELYENNNFGYNFADYAWKDYFAASYLSKFDDNIIVQEIKRIVEYCKWNDIIYNLLGLSNTDTCNKILRILINADPIFAAECCPIISNINKNMLNELFYTLRRIHWNENDPRRFDALMQISKIPHYKMLPFFISKLHICSQKSFEFKQGDFFKWFMLYQLSLNFINLNNASILSSQLKKYAKKNKYDLITMKEIYKLYYIVSIDKEELRDLLIQNLEELDPKAKFSSEMLFELLPKPDALSLCTRLIREHKYFLNERVPQIVYSLLTDWGGNVFGYFCFSFGLYTSDIYDGQNIFNALEWLYSISPTKTITFIEKTLQDDKLSSECHFFFAGFLSQRDPKKYFHPILDFFIKLAEKFKANEQNIPSSIKNIYNEFSWLLQRMFNICLSRNHSEINRLLIKLALIIDFQIENFDFHSLNLKDTEKQQFYENFLKDQISDELKFNSIKDWNNPFKNALLFKLASITNKDKIFQECVHILIDSDFKVEIHDLLWKRVQNANNDIWSSSCLLLSHYFPSEKILNLLIERTSSKYEIYVREYALLCLTELKVLYYKRVCDIVTDLLSDKQLERIALWAIVDLKDAVFGKTFENFLTNDDLFLKSYAFEGLLKLKERKYLKDILSYCRENSIAIPYEGKKVLLYEPQKVIQYLIDIDELSVINDIFINILADEPIGFWKSERAKDLCCFIFKVLNINSIEHLVKTIKTYYEKRHICLQRYLYVLKYFQDISGRRYLDTV